MKIKDVLGLEKGDPFKVEGNVFYTKKPKEFKGGKGTFYAQFLMIKDDSCKQKDDKLSVEVKFDNKDDLVENGMNVVIKGQVDEYKGDLKYKGKVLEKVVNQDKEKVDKAMKVINGNGNGNGNKKAEREYWEKREKQKNGSVARSVAVKGAVELMANKQIKKDDFWDWVHDLAGYVLLGAYPDYTDKALDCNQEKFDPKKSAEIDKELAEEEGNSEFDFGENKQKVASKS